MMIGDRLKALARGTRQPRPIPLSRTALPALFAECGLRSGAEVGVWRGAYSALFLARGIRMLCVDPWDPYPAWRDTKNALSGDEAVAFMATAEADARNLLASPLATIRKAYSVEAALEVPDGSLDFVYIDGNHGYAAVLEDLTAWTPKVRAGGVVAGHDYRVFARKPFVEVVRAVDDWTDIQSITPWYITAGDKTPSFLWVV